MKYRSRRHEICRFEEDELLYRVYFFEDGEISFTVTGDNIRLGLLTQEDLHWDWTFDLPRIAQTSLVVNVHSHSLKVLRTVVLRLAQYVSRRLPLFFYYQITDDRRRYRIYLRLWQRHAQAAARYGVITDETSQCVMFTLK